MPFSSRPAPNFLKAPCSPSERRDRSDPAFARNAGIPLLFERDLHASHSASHHRPAPVAIPPMGQVVELAATGVWVVKRNGALFEIDGRIYWDDRQALSAAAERAGIALSSIVVSTHSIF